MGLTYHGVASGDSPCKGVTIGAEANVDGYQSAYSKYANSAIDSLNFVLKPLAQKTLGYETVTAGVAATPDMPSFDMPYSAPACNTLSWGFTTSKFPVFAAGGVPDVKHLDATNNIPTPGPAPDNTYDINLKFPQIEPLSATVDQNAPSVTIEEIPDAPARTKVPDPSLFKIQMPEKCQIVDIPDFDATIPNLDGINPPDADFTWTDEAYDSAILSQVESRVSGLLQPGHIGIPEYVWDTIWARGRDKANKETRKATNEITEDWSARGFTLPQGAQVSRIDQAELKASEELLTLSRELIVEEAKQEFETLKYAIAQGQALENMIGGWHQTQMQRALDAAKFAYQSQVELFNAQITLYKAQVELFGVEALAYKTSLEGELAKLEEEKIRLEYEKIKGDLNQQEVQLYIARINTYDADIKAYAAYVGGIEAKMQANTVVIDGYKAEVQAYGELVKAKGLEFQNRKSDMEIEGLKANIFETEVRAYGSEVQAYGAMVDATYKPQIIDNLNNDNQFKLFQTTLETHNTKIKDKLAELEYYAKDFDNDVKLHNVHTKNELDSKTYAASIKKLEIDRAAQSIQIEVANAAATTQASVENAKTVQQASDMLSTAYSQLAASAMGVIHVSAGISDSASNSAGCSTSYSASV